MIQAKIIWGFLLLGIDLLVIPSFNLLIAMMIVIGLDLVTGVAKAVFKKVARTSECYRETIKKLMQYLIPVLLLWIGGRFIPEHKSMLQSASGYVMMFIIYIEATSIFENLYDIDSTSSIAKFFYKPALVILKFGIEKNAVVKAADKITEEEKKDVKPL